MRTTQAAASDVANQEQPELHWDSLMRNSKGREVLPPVLNAPVADTHAHLDMLHHPELSLARAAAHGVSFLVTVVDPTEDPAYSYQNLGIWQQQAAELLKGWGVVPGGHLVDRAEAVVPNLGDAADAASVPDTADAPGATVAAAAADTAAAAPYTADAPGATAAAPAAPAAPGVFVGPPHVRVIIGCHPHNASKYSAEIEEQLLHWASQPLTAGIGEIGLDYHYDLSPRPVQREVFKRQLALANTMMLPVALHLREAHDDGLEILRSEGLPQAGTLLHCFNLDFKTLKPFLDLGCYVAFGGPLTFKKCDDVRDAARQTPIERIVTETDAPFMAPEPIRGIVCGPEHTVFTAARLADTFGLSGAAATDFLNRLYSNARGFFDRERE